MRKQLMLNIVVYSYVGLFGYASLSKLFEFDIFQKQILDALHLESLGVFFAWGIPSSELIVAGLLLFSKWRRYALWSAISLMIIFTIYLVITAEFSDDIPCSCGGVLQTMGFGQHVLFNCVFILLGIVGIVILRKPFKPINREVATH